MGRDPVLCDATCDATAAVDVPAIRGYNDHMGMTVSPVVGARELKTRLGSYLRAVREGTTFVVTDRGRPVAELRPVSHAGSGIGRYLDTLAAKGLLTKGSGKRLIRFAAIRVEGRPVSEVLVEQREDRF